MPPIAIKLGFSLGSMVQLSIAPKTGIINFHMFRSDTFTLGRLSRVYQIDIAPAERKLNHPNER